MPHCENESCPCKSSIEVAWRQFFSLWELTFSPDDEKKIIIDAEKETGRLY